MKQKVLLLILIGILTSFSPKKITWVAIGDSITYLNDHPKETGNRITKGYYKNYTYPAFIDVHYNPATDEYPYPPESINMTYDGLHPSNKGYEVITKQLVKVMKKFFCFNLMIYNYGYVK